MNEPAAIVIFVAAEGRADDLGALLDEMAAVAIQDDGTEVYAVHRSRADPSTFFLYELYRDVEALRRHRANPALTELGGGLGELAASTEIVAGNRVGGDRARRA